MARGDGVPPERGAAPWRSDATPAESAGFATLSKTTQSRAYLRSLAAAHPGTLRLVEIGRSSKGRPLVAARLGTSGTRNDSDEGTRPAEGAETGKPRVLLFAQQHGNEPAGKEACLLLVRDLTAGPLRPLLESLDVWIVPQVNPDGAAARRRRTADGLDLNRSHHLLAAPEHTALYGLFHDVLPHLTLDLHEMSVEKEGVLPPDVTPAYDLMADGATNPNVGQAVRDLSEVALRFVADRLEDGGLTYRRYVKGDPSGEGFGEALRYSTLNVFDGRNTPALFGSLAFISEAMRHRSLEARLERRVHACYAAARAFLQFAAAHPTRLAATVEAERARLVGGAGTGTRIAVRATYRPAPQDPPLRYAYRRSDTGEVGEYTLAEARTAPKVTRKRALPEAYWVDLRPDSADLAALSRTLTGHRIGVERLPAPRTAWVEQYFVRTVTRARPDSKRCRARVDARAGEQEVPAGALVIPTAQLGGRLAALLLEPESMDGLVTNGVWQARPGEPYPVKRLFPI